MPAGWWEGTLFGTNKRGMFPDNFVRLLDADAKNSIALRAKPSSLNDRRCKVVFSYQENNSDELSLHVGDIIDVIEEVNDLFIALHFFLFYYRFFLLHSVRNPSISSI